MTTKKLYFCNLCKDEVDGATKRLARGFRFGNGRLDWDTVSQCENHLCDNCIDLLIATLRQAPPITAKSA